MEEEEFLGVAQPGRVAVVGSEHLHLVRRWKDLEETAQLLRSDVVVRPFADHLRYFGIARPELLQKDVDVEAPLAVQQRDLVSTEIT